MAIASASSRQTERVSRDQPAARPGSDAIPPPWTHLSPTRARAASRVLAVIGLLALMGSAGTDAVPWLLPLVVFLSVGALILNRWPAHRIGWVFVWLGVGAAASGLGITLSTTAVTGNLPVPSASVSGGLIVASLLSDATNTAVIAFFVPLSLLLFPDGRLPSPRWRMAVWGLVTAAIAGAVAAGLNGGWGGDVTQAAVVSPLAGTMVAQVAPNVFFPLLMALWLAGAASQFVRYRHASGVQRLQQRWLAAAVAVAAGIGVVAAVALPDDGILGNVAPYLIAAAFASLPLAAGVAILRHQLFDIDLVIRKSVIAALLLVFVTVAYIVLVVGVSGLLGAQTAGNPVVAVAASAAVAIAFQPARQRVTHRLNRLVYGQRASPYEVLSAFARDVATIEDPDSLLARAAAALASGTGAREVTVWLRVGATLRPAARFPDLDRGEDTRAALPLGGGTALPSLDADIAVAVGRDGALLGAVTLAKPRNEPPSAADEALTTRLAAQLGVALTNLRLGAELRDRAEDLAASRRRLLTAADDQRWLLHARLTAGAGQRLLAVRHGLVAAIEGADPASRAGAHLARLGSAIDDAIDELGMVASRMHPLGGGRALVSALRGAVARGSLSVQLEVGEVNDLPDDIGTTVYFCVLEALQNTAKHAGISRASVTVAHSDGEVSFSVVDAGIGFDPAATPMGAGTDNLRERLEAVGGTLTIHSTPGAGTVVEGRIPVGVG